MGTYSASFQGAAGTATLPIAGLRSGSASNTPRLLEVKLFVASGGNAARIRLVRLTTAGTASNVNENEMNEAQLPPVATAVHTYSSTAPTIASADIDIGAVAAAVGSGFHFTYYDPLRLYIPAGASDANGIALIEVADTANTYDGTFIWEE